jgi:hypothetical protein
MAGVILLLRRIVVFLHTTAAPFSQLKIGKAGDHGRISFFGKDPIVFPAGLKGRSNLAQGNALGTTSPSGQSPARAHQEREV